MALSCNYIFTYVNKISVNSPYMHVLKCPLTLEQSNDRSNDGEVMLPEVIEA